MLRSNSRLLAILILSLAATSLSGFHAVRSTSRETPLRHQILSVPSVTPLSTPVGPNIDIAGESPSDRQQVETTVVVDPHNTSIIVAGAQDLRLKPLEHRWHGIYRSTDNGQTWSNGLLPGYPGDSSTTGLSSPLHGSNATSDPVMAFDQSGNLYYAGLVFNISQTGTGGTTSGNLAFVAKYTNDGATYAGTTLIKDAFYADKEWIATANTQGPNATVYLAVDGSPTPTSNFATLFTRSTDGGRTFAPPFYAPADQTGNLPGMTVDPAGYVYVSSLAYDPVTGNALNYTQVTKISPDGSTILQNVRVVNPAYWLTPLPGAKFRTFTIPQMASDYNGVYLVFDDMRAPGNPNVYISRSTDGGTTWTSPLMINDPKVTALHFFPTITVSGGVISVAWYDSRNNSIQPPSCLCALDVYFAESLDGGVSFLPNMRVTSNSFDPNLVDRTDIPPFANTPFMGDYIGIAATPAAAHIVWADNLNACDTMDPTYGCVDQDAFTSTIGLADFSINASQSAMVLQQGTNATGKVGLTSLNNDQGLITVTLTPSPSQLTVSPTTASVTVSPGLTSSFNLTVTTTPATPTTTYTLVIMATQGPRIHDTPIYFTVVSPQPVGGVILPIDRAQLAVYLAEITAASLIIIVSGVLLARALLSRRRLDFQ